MGEGGDHSGRTKVADLFADRVKLVAFRDQLRSARMAVLRDSEAFDQVFFAVERLGAFLDPASQALGGYAEVILEVAGRSALAHDFSAETPPLHIPFSRLYDLVRRGRNQAAHEGAYARHLADHAVELSIVLEDALMADRNEARDYMVPHPTTAELWEPLSFIRQKMLLDSFSFLPVWFERKVVPEGEDAGWRLLSDRRLARYLRAADEDVRGNVRKKRLSQPLEEALQSSLLVPEKVPCCEPRAPLSEVTTLLDHRPVLVCDPEHPERLLGIITAYDLL